MKTLNERVQDRGELMAAVETAVTRLEHQIAAFNPVKRPLRRARARLPTRPAE
ncbi:MAG: hypothetical protein ACTHQQ_21020 [Solirubrobacteraceae bacterium]